MKNFHLPLPEQTYTLLKAEAERAQVPATTLAREAIDSWLAQQARKARHDAIAAHAAKIAGTDLDIDRDLELAGIERLVKTGRAPKMKRGDVYWADLVPRSERGLKAAMDLD